MKLDRLTELVILGLEEAISDEQIVELDRILRNDAKQRSRYQDLMETHGLLVSAAVRFDYIKQDQVQGEDPLRVAVVQGLDDSAIREALVREAQASEVKAIKRTGRLMPFSRSDVFAVLRRIAAVLVIATMIIFLDRWMWRQAQEPKKVIATLSDQLAAEWDTELGSYLQDGRMTEGPYGISEGFVSMRFNSGAEVVLEGPAQWRLDTEDRLYLFHGKMYASVPKQAVGFSVLSDHAKVIDLGTEFGIEVTGSDSTELYVTSGKVSLLSGTSGRNKYQEEVSEGAARKIDDLGAVQAIALEPEKFVRLIDSQKNLSWRGQYQIDLADIVGKGNGFGTGMESVGIDPATGILVADVSMNARVQEESGYAPVPDIPAIDGVFVPLGGKVPQIVSSRGDVFEECPDTDGRYWIEITNRPITGFQGDSASIQLARLNGIEYGSKARPAIMMHANTGITFDLDVIRSMIPKLQINRFTSICGLSETLNRSNLQKDASADLWILVDGRPQEKIYVDFAGRSHASISINIAEEDRFLTLISCSDWNAGDWTIYGDPVLELREVE